MSCTLVDVGKGGSGSPPEPAPNGVKDLRSGSRTSTDAMDAPARP
ncbi:hypothetical protein AB0D62_24885 [Streptomyces massasporeus]